MYPFRPGQRWLSSAEPELGLGTVLRLEGRSVEMLFAAAGTLRRYAMQSAPLVRAEFRSGDRIGSNGNQFTIDTVEARDGVLHYRCGDRLIPEGALDDVQAVSKASDRLLTGRVDPNALFELRLATLERLSQLRSSPAHGVLGARIDLIPHQLRVAEIAATRRPPRILFADEVGLGKTIEACLVIARLIASGRVGRVLVLVPQALVYQWFVELLRRFNLAFAIFDEERVESIETVGDGRNPFQDEQLVITDLPFLIDRHERAKQLVQAGWDLVVVDEAHHLQWSPESESPEYVLVEALARRTPGLLLLTATPEQLGRSGHFARLRLLDPARFHDLAAYQAETAHYVELSGLAERLIDAATLDAAQYALLERLLASDPDSGAIALLGRDDAEARAELLKRLIDRHGTGRVMFRNRRAVVGGFPRRVLHADVLERDLVNAAFAERHIEEFLGDTATPPAAPPLEYRDDPRLTWLIALLDAHPSEKFLLLMRSQPKLHALEEALRLRSGVAVARFHEGLGVVQRDRNAAHFADPEGARLLLCTEIGSEGRNFQFAHRLVLWDLPLDPDLLEQRIGRLDRIGQKRDVSIHVCVIAGSAQHALLRWYEDGLDAFRGGPEDGREILKRFGERLILAALASARAEPDAESVLEALINETRAAHEELTEAIARGRDRLLELATRQAAGGEMLAAAIATADADQSMPDYVLKLFEHFGVGVEEHSPHAVLLDPEMLTTEAFPGLDQVRVASFERSFALAREDAVFLRLDHPMVSGAMDLLLSAESGNAAFLVDDTLPPRTALLETVFVLECVAPPALAVDRFLPPTPIRGVIDTRLVDRSEFRPDDRSVRRSADRAVDMGPLRKPLAQLVPPMLAAAEKLARARAATLAAAAQASATAALGAEIARLEALARVNPSVRQSEIDMARDELAHLCELLPGASPRLDSLRFIASPDILGLRAR
jgi:ATP-dependent helicase HepA